MVAAVMPGDRGHGNDFGPHHPGSAFCAPRPTRLGTVESRDTLVTSRDLITVQRWWQELWNQGDLGVADDIVAATFTNCDGASPQFSAGISGAKALVATYRRCFPDLWFSIVQARRVSDAVVCHWWCRATPAGVEPGMQRSPHAWCAEGVSILHVQDEKIRRQATMWKGAGLLQHLATGAPLDTR